MKVQKEWFENWFSSPYYHILYKNRNDEEAAKFIDNIIKLLAPSSNAKILDAACGKGRHSIYLNKKGFDVTGIDLSEASIDIAKAYENDSLSFYTHDIRNIFRIRYYDFIFNLFTSFGYFKDNRDNLRCLKAFKKGMSSNGVLLIDFMNAKKAVASMKTLDQKIVDNIEFNISKSLVNGFIKKDIAFNDKGKKYSFQESVQALDKQDFTELFNKCGLSLTYTFGDYDLNEYDEMSSDRLIMICKASH